MDFHPPPRPSRSATACEARPHLCEALRPAKQGHTFAKRYGLRSKTTPLGSPTACEAKATPLRSATACEARPHLREALRPAKQGHTFAKRYGLRSKATPLRSAT